MQAFLCNDFQNIFKILIGIFSHIFIYYGATYRDIPIPPYPPKPPRPPKPPILPKAPKPPILPKPPKPPRSPKPPKPPILTCRYEHI
jgi:hypothetical protein